MNRIVNHAATAAIALAFGAGALGAQAMTAAEYKAGKERIASEFKSAKAACDTLAGNAKDICAVEATGRQKIAKAELEAGKSPSAKTRRAVGIAKAEAEYAIAKEKCDDKAGDAKTACLKEAKAAETRAKADVNAPAKAPVASKPAATPKASAAKESPGAYLDDSVITTKVKAAVLGEPTLKSAEINVETFKGTVQLSGFVSSSASKDKATQVARAVQGVKSVKNDMIIKGQQ